MTNKDQKWEGKLRGIIKVQEAPNVTGREGRRKFSRRTERKGVSEWDKMRDM